MFCCSVVLAFVVSLSNECLSSVKCLFRFSLKCKGTLMSERKEGGVPPLVGIFCKIKNNNKNSFFEDQKHHLDFIF